MKISQQGSIATSRTPMKYFAYIAGFGVVVALFVVGSRWPDAVDQLISFMTGIFRSTVIH